MTSKPDLSNFSIESLFAASNMLYQSLENQNLDDELKEFVVNVFEEIKHEIIQRDSSSVIDYMWKALYGSK